MDVKATRERWTALYHLRKQQVQDLIARIPLLGRLVTEFVRIEFIDRCMLIAAQGLLALVPLLVVVAAFFPHVTGEAVRSFAAASGVAQGGSAQIQSQLDPDQVKTQTGWIGLLITVLSATSFARAIQRMYERIWDIPHVGGLSGARRCLIWILGFLFALQIVSALRVVLSGGEGIGGVAVGTVGLTVQAIGLCVVWWVTSWVLLFGRVAWHRLLVGAVLTGVVGLLYNRLAAVFMPVYVRQNAEQFGTLGIILSVSTWLIGFAAVMVTSALVGRVVSEDPTVRRSAQRLLAGFTERPEPRS